MLKRLLNDIAEESLGFCSTSVEGQRRYFRSTHLMPYDSCANLWAVSMDDDNSKTLIYQSRYLGRCGSYVLILFFEGPPLIALKNRVPAEGENRDGGLTRQARFASSKNRAARRGSFCL